MREREEIENRLNSTSPYWPSEPANNGSVGFLIYNSSLILEVLLDIRDILAKREMKS